MMNEYIAKHSAFHRSYVILTTVLIEKGIKLKSFSEHKNDTCILYVRGYVD